MNLPRRLNNVIWDEERKEPQRRSAQKGGTSERLTTSRTIKTAYRALSDMSSLTAEILTAALSRKAFPRPRGLLSGASSFCSALVVYITTLPTTIAKDTCD
jgi:hypothetical protein